MNIRKIFSAFASFIIMFSVSAQVENAGGVRKRSERENNEKETSAGVSDRMKDFFDAKETHDADLAYMRRIYRDLDLTKPENSPLYYPEDVIDGQENLFRIILRLVVDGKIPAYEYLDGREVFSDQYKINVADMLERFGIYAQEAKGSTEKNPKFEIEEADVPTGQVLNYYVIEKWEFDRRSNRMKTKVEAICPVLNRSGDFGGDVRYPMFWVKFDKIRPYLAKQYVFASDDNNLPQYSLDDYFNLGLYNGEIYKTQNLRNLSMAQMFPDEDDMKRAQDSIDNRLRSFGKDLWVPSREEYLAMKERQAKGEDKGEAEVEIPERTVVTAVPDASSQSAEGIKQDDGLQSATAKTSSSVRNKRRSSTASATAKKKTQSKTKQAKVSRSSGESNSNAAKSVRRRRR